jgi:hypothetical protein
MFEEPIMSAGRTVALDRSAGASQPAAPDELARVALSLVDRVDELADRTTRRILATVPELRGPGTVPLHDLWPSVAANLRGALVMLAQRRGPTEAELAGWAALGRRRAQQGIHLEDVMRGLRVTNTVLWEILTEAALRADADCVQGILEQAGTVWETFDLISCQVANGHRAVASEQDVRSRRRGLELLAALRRQPDEHEVAEELARALGLDPNASFVVALHDRPLQVTHDSPTLAIELPDRTVVIVQTAEQTPAAEQAVGRLLASPGAHVGLGVARDGLAGAHQSLIDAEMAFNAARELDAEVIRFRDSWLECLALANREQHELLVDGAIPPLRTDPSVRATVVAFLSHDGSLAATAAHLGLHANTVAYRVRQFAERTGLDVRTASGAALAQVALALAGAPQTDVHEAVS